MCPHLEMRELESALTFLAIIEPSKNIRKLATFDDILRRLQMEARSNGKTPQSRQAKTNTRHLATQHTRLCTQFRVNFFQLLKYGQ